MQYRCDKIAHEICNAASLKDGGSCDLFEIVNQDNEPKNIFLKYIKSHYNLQADFYRKYLNESLAQLINIFKIPVFVTN